MQVRKDAWHYKLYKLSHDGYAPNETNLCTYFWRVVGGTFMIFFFTAVVLGALGGLGWLFYNHTFVSLSGLGLVVVVILCFVITDRISSRRSYESREPGLVSSYLKAKKANVCPIVTFVEAGR